LRTCWKGIRELDEAMQRVRLGYDRVRFNG
jgi:hypothetical protein